ncbi:MAG TPA: gliding motility-associated C-terminal domain-containing protein [Flavitalea sp.]|nr:gliding motility-associated C-terminal domain-containing protein [Flavitalea sp.]
MEFVPRPYRYIVVTAMLLFIGTLTNAQAVCETGYFSEYTTNGDLLPVSITTLHNGQQVITGQVKSNGLSRVQAMVARISETGDILWSKALDAGEGASLKGMVEKANGKYIVYGNLHAAAYSNDRIWIACLDQVGSIQWSRVIESPQSGPEKLYSLMELPDGDLLGTFNVADSTTNCRPVVFRMHDNGTIQWAREYAQNEAVGFNSLAFDNGTIYAAGFQKVGRKKAVIMLLDASNGDIKERRYPAYYKENAEQEAAFIQVFNNRISYTIDFREIEQGVPLFSTALVQGSLDNTTFYAIQKSGIIPDGGNVIIKRNEHNDIMMMRSFNDQSQIINHSQFGQINWSRRISRYAFMKEIHSGFDTTNGGGGISVGHFPWYTDNLNRMKIVRLTSKGNGGSCTDFGFTFHSDTLNLVHRNYNWSGIPADVPLRIQSTTSLSITPFVIQKVEECATTECTDLTALDPGCNKTMMVEYVTQHRSQFSDVVALGDGSRIAVGHNGYFPWVVKLRENGDVDWSRFYNQHNSVGELRKVIRLTSNSVLIAGNVSSTVDHGISTSNYLLKLDTDGNILKSQILSSDLAGEVADLVPTDDGGFLLIAVSQYGFPPIYNFVTRYDANMQIVWKKRLDVFAADPISRSVHISNGKIYLGHDYYPQSWKHKVGIAKMDLATGKFEWARTYEVTNDGSPLRFNRIATVKDTLYAFINQERTDATGLLMVRISQQGKVIDGRSIGNFPLVTPFSYTYWDLSRTTVMVTPELDFVTANLVKTPGGQALNISRFGHTGDMVWSRNYDSYKNHTVYNIRPHALGYQMVGKVGWNAGQLDRNFINAFFMKTDSIGKLTLASTGECAPVDAPYTTSSVVIDGYADTGGITGVLDNDWLKTTSMDVLKVPALVDATLTCHRQSDCILVTLGMIGDICKVDQPVRLYLENNNCGSIAKWKFDTIYFSELKRTVDSLVLMPRRSGTSEIIAEVENDCSSRVLSMPIAMAVVASSLELGRDTILCANTILTLKAGLGFQNYSWNDGSTDPELQVTRPGKYFVRVKDFCGNEGSDTVVVSDPKNWFDISGPLQKCNADSIRLKVPGTFSKVIWSANSSILPEGNTAIVYPLQTASFYAQAEWIPGCVVRDTVEITVLHSPALNLQSFITACYNDTVALTAPAGFTNYTWSTGEVTSQIRVHEARRYTLSALYTNGCTSVDTVKIEKRSFAFPQLGPDKSFCANEASLLSPGQYSRYLWSTGESTAQIYVSAPGLYYVTVTDNYGCQGADTMEVKSILQPPTNYLPTELNFCAGQELKIMPSGSYSKYEWSTGSSHSSISVKDTSLYVLKVIDFNGCIGTDSVWVQYKSDCPQSIHFPNAFSPNGDGVNDNFSPMIRGLVSNYQFEIFNRWGERTFISTEPNQGWDGRIKGLVQPTGGFVWKCSYQFPGQALQKRVGTVVLVR